MVFILLLFSAWLVHQCSYGNSIILAFLVSLWVINLDVAMILVRTFAVWATSISFSWVFIHVIPFCHNQNGISFNQCSKPQRVISAPHFFLSESVPLGFRFTFLQLSFNLYLIYSLSLILSVVGSWSIRSFLFSRFKRKWHHTQSLQWLCHQHECKVHENHIQIKYNIYMKRKIRGDPTFVVWLQRHSPHKHPTKFK